MTKKRAGSAGGGVTISGSTVNTGGGSIVGRDQHISQGKLADIFHPIAKAIEDADPAQKPAATSKLDALVKETAKGKDADDSTIGKLLDGLVGLVPSAVGAVVGAFSNPLLGAVTGPVTKFVLEKFQNK